MSFATVLNLLLSAPTLIFPFFAIFTRCRHLAIGLLSIPPALLASLGAWYAFVETHSLTWTIGYTIYALLCFVAAILHFLHPNPPAEPFPEPHRNSL